MKGYLTRIILVLVFASTIRLWGLGDLPSGISLTEAKLGLYLFKYFGDIILNPFWLRLPFAVFGIITLPLTYKLVLKVSGDKNISFLVFLILSTSPWHIIESRIAGYGIPLLFIFLVTAILLEIYKINFQKMLFVSLVLFIGIFAFGLLENNQALENKLALQRNSLPNIEIIYRRIFINRYVENFLGQQKIIFENIDFGNYFFKGHPRERWGIEETQKLFVFLLPFLIIGFLKIDKNVAYFILSWSVFVFSIILLNFNKHLGIDLLLLVPLSIVVSYGIVFFRTWFKKAKKIVLFFTLFVGIFEFLSFGKDYLSGNSESTFSPRKPIYKDLATEIIKNKKNDDNVLVTTRLTDSEYFLKFYDSIQENCERTLTNELNTDMSSEGCHLGKNFDSYYKFQDFNSKTLKEERGIIVDILPYDPGPSEALFTENDSVPEFINLIKIIDDKKSRQMIYIFRLK